VEEEAQSVQINLKVQQPQDLLDQTHLEGEEVVVALQLQALLVPLPQEEEQPLVVSVFLSRLIIQALRSQVDLPDTLPKSLFIKENVRV